MECEMCSYLEWILYANSSELIHFEQRSARCPVLPPATPRPKGRASPPSRIFLTRSEDVLAVDVKVLSVSDSCCVRDKVHVLSIHTISLCSISV